MKCVYFLVVVATLVVAEQPSHSYLPPSPTGGNNGYSKGAPADSGFQGPQIIAARTSVQANSANGFARSNPSDYHKGASRGQSQGYDDGAAAFARSSIDGGSSGNYEADERGSKSQISYEDSEDLVRSSGYNSKANSRNYGNYKNGGQDARGY